LLKRKATSPEEQSDTGNKMSTSREKINRIIDIITERFGIMEIDLFVKKVDIKKEVRRMVAEIDDSKLDALLKEIKKVVNED
jgi:hypothetical protein